MHCLTPFFCLHRLSFCSKRSLTIKTLQSTWQGGLDLRYHYITVIDLLQKVFETLTNQVILGHSLPINNRHKTGLLLTEIWATLPVE